MPLHLRRFIAATLVLFMCGWVLREAPGRASSEQDQALKDARELQVKSQALLAAGRLPEALAMTEKLHRSYPSNHIYLARLADLHERLEQWPECAADWEAYIKVSPTPWEAFPTLGNTYLKMGRTKEAIDAFARGLDLEPENPDAVFFLGRAHEHDHQFQQAKTIYGKGLQKYPNYTDLRVGLARMILFTATPAEARKVAEEAVKRSPESSDARLVLGMALRSLGDLAGARSQLEQARNFSPDYVDVLQVLGGVAEQQGDLRTAKAAYERILQLTPGHPAASARLAGIQKGSRP